MLHSTYVGLELAREVRRILTDCATELEALLNQLPADRPETWRALLDALLAQWERVGIKITAASRASLYALLEQARAAQPTPVVGTAFAPRGAREAQFIAVGLVPEAVTRLMEFAKALDEALVSGKFEKLIPIMREIAAALPELVPGVFDGGIVEDAARKAQETLDAFIDFVEALPPESHEAIPDLFQAALDITGLIPGWGEVMDALSGVISARRGDWIGAVLSVLSLWPALGTIPGVAKILRRLAVIGKIVDRMKGIGKTVLRELIDFLMDRLKGLKVLSWDLPTQIKELYEAILRKLKDLTDKLRRSKQPPETPTPKPNAPEVEPPKTPDGTPEKPHSPDGPDQKPKPYEPDAKQKADEPNAHVKPDDGFEVGDVLDFKRRPGMAERDRSGTKIYGTAQSTKSKGVETAHAKTVDEVADKMADSGEYERIFVNRSYGTATDMNVSKRRPDVIGVRKDGKVDVVEVVSKNDKPKQLEKRMEEGLQTLPKERRGKSSTVEMQAERE